MAKLHLHFKILAHSCRIDRKTRQALVRATLHMVNREFESLAEDFVALGMLPEQGSAAKGKIVKALTGALCKSE